MHKNIDLVIDFLKEKENISVSEEDKKEIDDILDYSMDSREAGIEIVDHFNIKRAVRHDIDKMLDQAGYNS